MDKAYSKADGKEDGDKVAEAKRNQEPDHPDILFDLILGFLHARQK